MRRWTRGWKTFCLTLMVLTSFCMGVGVSQGLEAREVTAQLRPDFVIVIDQETAHFSDVNGSEVYPLLYEGTTYLPLRAIGNLMGKQVDWDEQSKTVTLSDALRESVGVERVVDGDTLEVLWRGNLEKVRLIGVDTAESAHPDEQKNTEFGRLAAAYTKEALEGKTVELEFDVQQRDQYGRLLCYVYLDGEMFNERLLEEGMAAVSTWPPNVKYVESFTQAQQRAKEAGAGMWEGYVPQDFGITEQQAQSIVYVTATGEKYHKSSTCGVGTYFESTLQQALEQGLTACDKCW